MIWGNYQQWSKTTKNYLLAAAAFSALMLLIDGAFPREMIPRPSLEDLSKTWANAFIFMFAWSILIRNINALKSKAQNPTSQPPHRNLISTRIEKVNYN